VTALLWLRRDLRRGDHPALVEAARRGTVVPVFVLDPGLWDGAGDARRAWLAATVAAADAAYDGVLCVRKGDAVRVLTTLAREVGAKSVHVTRETTPYGVRRDRAVAKALAAQGVEWLETGTPYAVGPGLLRTGTGDGYQVFTPFYRAWRAHGWPGPAPAPTGLRLEAAPSHESAWSMLRAATAPQGLVLPDAGEEAARRQWQAFRDDALSDYDTGRDPPARPGTSRLSPHLKLGTIHPRTVLADISGQTGQDAERFRTELAWREFYADVLHHHPGSAWTDLKPGLTAMGYDDEGPEVDAWRQGRTGFPFVDAGMRQLLAEGWMHNRARMVTASFLTKDLHVWWPLGARHFLDHLIDGDLASNNHGWQWVAGTGTDASPYFRVFNPVTQGLHHDPGGEYVRRWVPELRHLPGAATHEPWKQPDGYAHGYPQRLVDHAEERREALRRYEQVRK
jgi:deoxyribodipyrimidine photo-lyase